MPDERVRSNLHSSPSPEPEGGLEEPGSYERFIIWAAGLPWWAIILGVVAVVVLYSMLTSTAYRRVIQSLTDNPQTSTTDLYSVVEIVGEPIQINGRYVSETSDTIASIIDALLSKVIGTDQVTHSGFIIGESASSLTVRTTDGTLLTVAKDQIIDEQRTETRDGTQIQLTYTNRVTVTGVLTATGKRVVACNDEAPDCIDGQRTIQHALVIRTVDEQKETFDPARIINRTFEEATCGPDAAPDCQPTEIATLDRAGELVTGKLSTLSNVNLSLQLPDGSSREIRRSDIAIFNVPTLTIAINQASANVPVQPGQEVRIGFVEGTDITAALDELNSLEDVPVPLRYASGDARAVLVPYPDLDTALTATGAGEVGGMLYLDSGPDRLAVQTWVDDHPNAGVTLPTPPRECSRGCQVSVKLKDDSITGRIAAETADSITVVTTEAQYVTVDEDKIIETRRKEPGVCALNNLRGCNAGIFLTLRVTFQAYALALILGLFFGLMRVQTNPVLYAFSTLYVEVIRGIPLLVILLYAGFVVSPELRDGLTLFKLQWFGSGLPDFVLHFPKLNLSDEQEAVIGLAFGYGAFIAEIFRAGIQSISRGQMEAARSLGMSYPQAMRFVVLPQAVRVVLPPLGNDFIAMLKDSALISVLALPDLLQLGRLYVSRTFRAFEGYNTVAILYLLMTLFLSMLVRVLERRSRLPG